MIGETCNVEIAPTNAALNAMTNTCSIHFSAANPNICPGVTPCSPKTNIYPDPNAPVADIHVLYYNTMADCMADMDGKSAIHYEFFNQAVGCTNDPSSGTSSWVTCIQ